jgi:hypothetical protein
LVIALTLQFLSSDARGETFVFHDPEQPQASGRVLQEFPQFLFVVLDGQPPTFLRRAELKAVITEKGRTIESPSLGTLAPVSNVIPAAALTEVSGVAWRRDLGAKAQAPGQEPADLREGEHALPELEGGAEFLIAGAGVRTGDNGMVRGVFPSGAEFWVGVDTQLDLDPSTSEGLRVVVGEVVVGARLRPLALLLPRPLMAQVEPASRVVVTHQGEKTHLEQVDGQTQLAWPEMSLVLSSGHGLDVQEIGLGRWRIKANEANPGSIDLVVGGRLEELLPGAEREIGVDVPPEGDVWRVLSANGELLLRRGLRGRFSSVGPLRHQDVAVGYGDALRTSGGGEALLGRVDGARLTLRSASHLEVDDALELVSGGAILEALDSPVKFGTPGGVASFDHLILSLVRSGSSLGDPLELQAVGGRPTVPLGAAAELRLSTEAKSRVAREVLSDPSAGSVERAAPLVIYQLLGTSLIRSRGLEGIGDAKFVARLAQGDGVTFRPPHDEAYPHGALAMAKDRLLRFVHPGSQAEVLVASAQLRFGRRPLVDLAEGLTLDVGRAKELPLLRFKTGETILLRGDMPPLRVENPTIEVAPTKARVKLEGGVEFTLQQGGQFGAAAMATRVSDHLEVRGAGKSLLAQVRDQVRYTLGDGRALWIQPKAPPVDARFGNAKGSWFLSMPGAPSLGLRPDRRLTVLATNEGEFVILDDEGLGLGAVERLGLDAPSPNGLLERDRLLELLEVPRPDSPSGP